MKFLKKYGLALVLTAAMIVLAVNIGRPSAPEPDNPDYYGQWIADEAGLLSAEAERAIAEYNEQLDETYGSIVGLITVESWDGADPEEFTYAKAESMGFGEWDFVLALSEKERDFYFAFGASSGAYANSELETTVIRHMTQGVYGSEADRILPELYGDLTQWYENHISEAMGDSSRSGGGAVAFLGGIGLALVLLLVLVFVIVLVSALSRSSVGGTAYVHAARPWYYRPFRSYRRYAPPPPPPMGGHFGGFHRPTSSRSSFGGSSRSGGFGGSSRSGSFGGSRRGGFGGSSRGGFGGKR